MENLAVALKLRVVKKRIPDVLQKVEGSLVRMCQPFLKDYDTCIHRDNVMK